MELISNAGIFAYPLALFSFVTVFITIERLIALRNARVIPRQMVRAFVDGESGQVAADNRSVMGRIVLFFRERDPEPDAVNAFARLEVTRMERGVFLLEIVIGAAPLLGLLGTVTGLTQVFGGFSGETGLPDPAIFITGIALALNTTILGLSVAIPALIAHAYLIRRIDSLAARIAVGVECLTEASAMSASAPSSSSAVEG